MSDVSITLMMIGFSILLLGLLWIVIVNVFHSSPKEIINSIRDLSSEFKIESASQNEDGSVSISVKRSQGREELSKILFVISDDKSTEMIEKNSNLKKLEQSVFVISKNELENLSFVRNLSIIPIYADELENKTIENAVDSFEFSNKDIIENLGAVSWYRFQENLKDEIGVSNGVYNANLEFSDSPYGKSVKFNGIDDYVDLGDFSILNGKESFSVSFWIYRDEGSNFETNGGIFSRGSNNAKSPWIYGYKDTRAIFAQFGTNIAEADCSLATNSVNSKQWVHIVFVWDGNECKFYENGKLTNRDPTKGATLINSDDGTFIGKNHDGEYFEGSVDEIIVFGKPLNEKQVKIIHEINLT